MNTKTEKKWCHSELATRPLLYTDTLGGDQTRRDDLWAVTTDELNTLKNRLEITKAMLAVALVEMRCAETVYIVLSKHHNLEQHLRDLKRAISELEKPL